MSLTKLKLKNYKQKIKVEICENSIFIFKFYFLAKNSFKELFSFIVGMDLVTDCWLNSFLFLGKSKSQPEFSFCM